MTSPGRNTWLVTRSCRPPVVLRTMTAPAMLVATGALDGGSADWASEGVNVKPTLRSATMRKIIPGSLCGRRRIFTPSFFPDRRWLNQAGAGKNVTPTQAESQGGGCWEAASLWWLTTREY